MDPDSRVKVLWMGQEFEHSNELLLRPCIDFQNKRDFSPLHLYYPPCHRALFR